MSWESIENRPTIEIIEDSGNAHNLVDSFNGRVVIEAIGLLGGKGVMIATTSEESHQAIEDLMEQRRFGRAGSRVIISPSEKQD